MKGPFWNERSKLLSFGTNSKFISSGKSEASYGDSIAKVWQKRIGISWKKRRKVLSSTKAYLCGYSFLSAHSLNTGRAMKCNGGVVRVWPRVADLNWTSFDRMCGYDAI